MAGSSSLSFDTLRTWNGEQSRAFEELSFQLLKSDVPAGTRAIRTGNPDGGVEWYATLPDGTEWGWQAKHVKDVDDLLTAMTDSVKRVAKERPNLRKLTFAISRNLSTGTSGNQRKSQRKRYEDKVETWKKAIPGANKITFELVQESDLLNELAKPEHNGRRWFWWGTPVLGHDWLKQRYEEQSLAAGEKYRPDLQVDIPIQEDMLAVGFDQSILDIFNRLRRDVTSAITDLYLSPKDEDETAAALYQAVRDTASKLKTTAGSIELQAGDPPNVLTPLTDDLASCARAIENAEAYEHQLTMEWQRLPQDDPRKAQRSPERTGRYGVRTLGSAIHELTSWLDSSVGRSLQRRRYFLTGQAGSGKTHLLLDATRRALDANRPAVFLAGAQFGRGDLWASITDQLGLQPVGADVLLRAMDAAGEAASMSGCRFVIFVDALNETVPPDFWSTYLPRLRAAVAQYPHVALVVSCRDTYQDLVLEGNEGAHYVRQAHPGFAEREVEATQRYFDHYGLEAPKIPLLTPEFTLPLFLRLYCESLSQAEPGSIPTGHQGRVAIFERYLNTKVSTVARRLRSGASSSFELEAARTQIRHALDSLLDELSRLGRESMSVGAAREAVRSSLDGLGTDSARLLGVLQEEGVLTRERLYLGDGVTQEGVRIVFQAFADFLLLKRRLALSADPLDDDAIRSWLTNDCSWGIIEAAAVLFPEVYGVELPDYLHIKMTREPDWNKDSSAWDKHHRARQLHRSLVEALPYRDSQAISQRTIDLLNAAQPHLLRSEFYRVLFTLAPQPGNRLNGDGLHKYLTQVRMPRRDSDFGFATYHEISDAASPAARLARWAAAGPYPNYDAEVLELACIPLCWLLSSPNRFMRDWVTKALVQLLHGHLDVMRALVERFWLVDDPYVVQRVIVIAYGSLLRSTPAQANEAKLLAQRVLDLVFTRPIRPDELMLDAARGIVRWAVTHGLLPASAASASQRPYGLKVPGSPPSKETIDAKYGWHEGQPADESYSSIRFSLLSMGDFARYVVEPGVHYFSRYRIGQKHPDPRDREPRFHEGRLAQFLSTLSDEQKASLLSGPFADYEDAQLTSEQLELLQAASIPRKPVRDEYSEDFACRWIFRRVLSLGWSPRFFGNQDRSIGHGHGREAHKAERWGKKYQWMAYHELLARIADNYQSSRRFDDSEPYEGLHQIAGDREIDPSLPPIAYRAFIEHPNDDVVAWGSSTIRLEAWPPERLDFSRYKGDIKQLLSDTDSEPTIAGSIFARDSDGDEWVVLDGSFTQTDPTADKRWRGIQQYSAIHTLLVPAGEGEGLLTALPEEPEYETHNLFDSYGHTSCCYVGEVGRAGLDCSHRYSTFIEVTVGEQSFHVVPPIEQYSWDGTSWDCSISTSATTVLPSTFIQQAAALAFDMQGPSWMDAAGSPMFTYYKVGEDESSAFLVRASYLRTFLAEHKAELVIRSWFERMQLSDQEDGRHLYVQSSSTAILTSELSLHPGASKRESHLK